MRFVIAAILMLLSVTNASAQDRYGSSASPPPFSDLGDAFSPPPSSPQAPAPSAGSDSRYGSTSAGQSSSVAPLSSGPQPKTNSPSNPLRQNAAPLAPADSRFQPRSQPAQPRPIQSPPAGPISSNNSLRGGAPRQTPLQASAASNDPRTEHATKLMRAMLTAPSNSQLSGSPLTLSEVVAGAASRAEQTRRIEAYGDLCSSVADYYLGLLEAEALRRLQRKIPAASSALRQAETELNVRVGTSQKAAVASQERLASMMGRSTPGLPGDLPFCGAYNTKYEDIFGRGGTSEAQHLHELIPLRHQELIGAAEAVGRAESWVDYVAKQPSETGGGMVRALELLALNRRAFVQIARDYNRRITRYTELSRPGRIDNGRLVAMLIGRPSTRLSSSTGSPSGSSPGVTFRSPQR